MTYEPRVGIRPVAHLNKEAPAEWYSVHFMAGLGGEGVEEVKHSTFTLPCGLQVPEGDPRLENKREP